MTDTAVKNCAKVLLELGVPEADADKARGVWDESEELRKALCCPAVKREEKQRVIDKVFPESMKSYIKVMEKYGHIAQLSEIVEQYKLLKLEQKEALSCTLYCVSEPSADILRRYEQTLMKKYGASSVVIKVVIKPELIGGCILQVGDKVYDKSVKSAVAALQSELLRR